jgi:hypothetical protein
MLQIIPPTYWRPRFGHCAKKEDPTGGNYDFECMFINLNAVLMYVYCVLKMDLKGTSLSFEDVFWNVSQRY